MNKERVAVIGAGVAGLTAAYLLRRRYDVTIFEADTRLGGHAHTHRADDGNGGTVAVDSGFIVHNDRTYPNLRRLFTELGVPTRDSEMSMSIACDECGLEYAGGKGLAGVFPTWPGAVRPAYLAMLATVRRFHRQANALLDRRDDREDEVTLDEFLTAGRYSRYFVDHFALPVVSTVWSADHEISGQYPARYLFEFLRHHGMLSIGGSPQWRTVAGGAAEYVNRIARTVPDVHTALPVRAVHRRDRGVDIRDENDHVHHLDRVVLACHADQALALLAEPTPVEVKLLGAFHYSANETVLHTDPDCLPVARRARASWNYRKSACHTGTGPVRVTYDMNRLMRLPGPRRFFVSLNQPGEPRPERVLTTMSYQHPIYTPDSVAAQRKLPEISDHKVQFAGAYHGWGFHEDGCASGVRAATAFGSGWPA